MADLIERQAAIDAVRRLQTYKFSESDDMVLVDKAEVQTELMMLPSAQPEIVRCKDCKYRDAESGFCEGRGWPMQLVPDDGFCNKGKRSEE